MRHVLKQIEPIIEYNLTSYLYLLSKCIIMNPAADFPVKYAKNIKLQGESKEILSFATS
jgi:hypothetical protein